MADSKVIYLDTASLDQLLQIPQIGATRAEIIIRIQQEVVLAGGSLTLDHFTQYPEIATALNASENTGLLHLGPGRNGGLAGAPSPEHQAQGEQKTQEVEIVAMKGYVRVLSERVSREMGVVNTKCDKLGEALSKFDASIEERDNSMRKSMADMMDQFVEKNRGFESALLGLGQRMDKVEKAGQPVGKQEPSSDPFFAVIENVIAQKAPPVPARFNKVDGEKEARAEGTGKMVPPQDSRYSRNDYPKLKNYSGSGDFLAYLEKFERLARCKGWTEVQKLDQLIMVLSDDALDYFQLQKPEIKVSYDQTKKSLIRMYGRETNTSVVQAELASIVQKEGEEFEAFGQRIFKLLHQAYPLADDSMLEQLGIGFFSKGCSDRYAVEVAMIREPKTLRDIVQYAKVAQSNHTWFGSKKVLRNATFDDDKLPSIRRIPPGPGSESEGISKINDTLEKMMSLLDKMAGQGSDNTVSPVKTRALSPTRSTSPVRSPTSPSRYRCYNCNVEGHISRDCPRTKSSRFECYNCHAEGHLARNCPESVSPKKTGN